jgi:AcrR family transcriptional regulator
LDAAPEQSATAGYDRTSIRAIARQADVDPALVHHYFRTKHGLLAACIGLPDEAVEVVAGFDPVGLSAGELAARALVVRSQPELRKRLTALLRVSISNPEAQQLYVDLVRAARLEGPDPELQASLAASHAIGVALARFVFQLEPLASADDAVLARLIAPALDAYLNPSATQLTTLDVLADETEAAPAQLAEAMHDPPAAAAALGDNKARALFVGADRDLVTLPSAISAYRQLFSEIADGAHRPALFHCTTGKDRTGWAAAALLMLLGVGDDDVMTDYLLTDDELLPQLQPIFDRFQAAGGDPSVLRPVLGVGASYLEASIEHMHATYGDVHGYFSVGLAIPDATLQLLREGAGGRRFLTQIPRDVEVRDD